MHRRWRAAAEAFMGVKLIAGGKPVFSLTSPPPQPEPYPPKDLIAERIQYEDRDIFVTVPIPDTIVLLTDVFNHHLTQPVETGVAGKALFNAIDKEMHEKVAGYKTYESFAPCPVKVWLGAKAGAVFKLPYDPTQPLWNAELTIRRRQGPDYGIWSVRLEFSVSKAGPDGLVQLTSLMHDIIDPKVDSLLGTMRVRRLDAAIDLIGAEPIDLIAHVKKPGKRMVYVGDSGRPESLYLYERKPWLTKPPSHLGVKTTGPLRLKLYERRSFYEQLALDPTWGPSPVTRAEVSRTWKKNEPLLAALASLKNPFCGCRVAYAAAVQTPTTKLDQQSWIRFCLAVLGGGASKAQGKAGLGQGSKLRLVYDNVDGDLINDTRWKSWAAGLSSTGLNSWVDLANAHPAPSV